jgi:hypothetical protein
MQLVAKAETGVYDRSSVSGVLVKAYGFMQRRGQRIRATRTVTMLTMKQDRSL